MATIKARSPYYKSYAVTVGTHTAVEFQVKVYYDDIDDIPATAQNEITKPVPDVTLPVTVGMDISTMIREFFQYTPITETITGLYAQPARTLLKVDTAIVNQVDTSLSTSSELATDGYHTFAEGANYTTENQGVMITNDYYVVNKDHYFNVAVINDDTHTKVRFNSVDYTLVNPAPSGAIQNMYRNMWINLSGLTDGTVYPLEIYDGITLNRTIYLEVREECKYTPINVMFINKWGMYELMPFFKSNTEGLSVSSKNFEANIVSDFTYDTSAHQSQRFETNGKRTITINSGYVPETSNNTIAELLLSEHVWIYDPTSAGYLPVNIGKTKKSFKTKINDKLISHELQLQFASPEISTI